MKRVRFPVTLEGTILVDEFKFQEEISSGLTNMENFLMGGGSGKDRLRIKSAERAMPPAPGTFSPSADSFLNTAEMT